VIAVEARRVTDEMFIAAGKALAAESPARLNPKKNLLPPVSALRENSFSVALAVAREAQKQGLAKPDLSADAIEDLIRAKVWKPQYVLYSRI
jgi:malate dehydrogenase (oxaloacetate-decarboxylating)